MKKKRILSLLLTLTLIISTLFSMGVTTSYAAGGEEYQAGITVTKVDDSKLSVSVDVGPSSTVSSCVISGGVSYIVAYDPSVFKPLLKNGKDVTEIPTYPDTPVGKVMAYYEYEDATTLEKWETRTYVFERTVDGVKTGFVIIQPAQITPCTLTTTVSLAKIYLGFQDGKGYSDVTAQTVRFATGKELKSMAESAALKMGNLIDGTFTWNDGDAADTFTGPTPTLTASGFSFVTPALAGSASVNGTPKIGETLTADTTGITSPTPGTLTYKWYYDGDATSIGTGATYTISKASDVGKTIKVDVSAANYSGVLTGTASAAVTKADCATTATAATVNKTSNTVTVTNVISGQEYAITTGSTEPTNGWNTTGSFTGLTANTAYKVYTRVKATATHNASTAAAPTSVTTDKLVQTITAPTSKDITFGGKLDLSTVCFSDATGATLNYSTTGMLPTGTKLTGNTITAGNTAGTFTVKVNSPAFGNYAAAAEKEITINIVSKKAQTLTDFAVSNKTYTYGDTPVTQTVTKTAGDGAVTYSSSNTDAVSVNEKTGALTIKKATTSDVTITATAAETEDYAEATKTYTVTVNKKELEITGLTATNRDYAAGNTDVALTGGTLSGVVNAGEVTCAIPTTGTMADANAGSGKTVNVVTPALTGSNKDSYTLKTISGITVTINQADPAIGDVTYTGTTLYPSTAPGSVTLNRADTTVGGTLGLDGVTALTVGTNNYNWKFTPTDTTNYKTVTGKISLTVAADALVKIESTAPAKTTYKYGEAFEINGATVTATFASGATLNVTDAVTFGALKVGDTSVELTYVSDGVTKTCTINGLTVNKADAKTLVDKKAAHKIGLTAEQTISVAGLMPSDAGTLTYSAGAKTDANGIISSWSVTADGTVKYTLTGTGAAGNTATLPVTIKSENYADSTVNVIITLKDKDVPTATANDINVTYNGEAIPASKITGTASVPGTWSFKTAAPTSVADSGTKTVVFTPNDTANYATVEVNIQVTINKAKPTGTPKFTAITEEGKTLADAALVKTVTGAADGFNVAGTVAWNDGDSTAVEANKSYGWTFTPTDTTNYETATGTAVVWVKINPATKYTATITDGTGSGKYEKDAKVTITANAAPEGKEFDKWEVVSGKVTLENAAATTTTFAMPASSVAIKAVYKDKPAAPVVEPEKVALKNSLSGYNDIKTSWNAVPGADGYKVYYKKASATKYTYKTSTTKTSIKLYDLSSGTKYYVKIVPYTVVDGKKVNGDAVVSSGIYTMKKLSAPAVTKTSSGKIKVTWKNIYGESGYQISKSTSSKKTGTVYTVKTTKGTYKTITAKKGKTYYYKVRSYKIVDGKKVYAPWSKVKAYKL